MAISHYNNGFALPLLALLRLNFPVGVLFGGLSPFAPLPSVLKSLHEHHPLVVDLALAQLLVDDDLLFLLLNHVLQSTLAPGHRHLLVHLVQLPQFTLLFLFFLLLLLLFLLFLKTLLFTQQVQLHLQQRLLFLFHFRYFPLSPDLGFDVFYFLALEGFALDELLFEGSVALDLEFKFFLLFCFELF